LREHITQSCTLVLRQGVGVRVTHSGGRGNAREAHLSQIARDLGIEDAVMAALRGRRIGSIGPTTGGRMDKFTPKLLALGLKGTLGKGARSQPVKDALRQHKAVYLGAIGGAGAVLSGFVKKLEVVAYEDLGTEAIRRLEVAGFPAIVVNDCHGGDLYQDGMKAYAREGS